MAAKPRYVESAPRPHIDCCYQGCPNPARLRVWTKTGWANVCARVNALEVGTFHYEQIEQMPRRTSNFYLDEIRKARSVKTMQRAQREPGSDDDLPLGIGRDALEVELAERMEP